MVVKSFLVLLILLFVPNDPGAVAWSEDYKLSWNDFIGKHNPGSPYAASTHSSIIFSYNVTSENGNLSLTTQVDAYFYPELSWFKPGEVNNHILKHEQAHFDITEIHARKLRKAYAEYKVTKNFEKELSAIFTRINQDRQKMQQQFDRESDHSRNYKNEARWQLFVAAELKRLEKWKN
jgi:predicted metal-dependent peptidase